MNNYQKPDQAKNKKQFQTRVNWNIRNKYCRVIENGVQPKIMELGDAIAYAESRGMDLIEIGYDRENRCSNCKICDYGKFVYEQKRREKEAKRQARANKVETKSLQISIGTDKADLERIIKHAREFLEAGDRVKFALRFRNRRESANLELAKKTLYDAISVFEGFAVLDSKVELNGRELSCVLRKA